MLRSEIIDDPAALAALAPRWRELWAHSRTATPFQSPAWLVPWWRAFAPGELATIAVWRGDDLVGLAPLYLEHATSGSRLLPVGISLSDYLDVLCLPGIEAAVAAVIADRVVAIDWSQWILPDLPAGAAGLTIAHPALEAVQLVDHAACPVLSIAGDDALAVCVPARRRRQLRRAHNAARRRGRVSIIPAQADLKAFFDHLIRLHRARWAGRGDGVLADPVAEEFHRQALPMLAEQGLVRCWLVAIDDAVVGAYYGFHYRHRAYAYLGGFDPDYAEESPGAILIGHAIAEAAREGAREFDFLRGQESYKYGWGAVDQWTMRKVWTRSMAQ
ncbi:GNAT family N-acetyltransferase [Mesorhizobium sp.]|uniref:GNAT family N-acetyltransferase n=3 Tax=Mesorhizobium sp. TaxID=1871066 RepID=UPI000FE9EC06|nr:GNAT family N-acetyltransferase [Mesorhizobium sp.]RWK57610.1 MAG: GNAT family N-acetyltransferase [Mesorhizobium sp.]TIP47340.1 MAG: GNAT family N-acetyltransferase [Mesorhizobium sp.]